MSGKPQSHEPEFVVIGRITKPHGVRGAVRVEPLTDFPERFDDIERVLIRLSNDEQKSFDIDRVQAANPYLIFSLSGITNRNQAEELRNGLLEIPKDQVRSLPDGSYYYFELIGLRVQTETGELIGTVEDIQPYPAQDVYVVKHNGNEILIPDTPDIVTAIDMESGVITIHPIEGLLE